MKLKGLTRSAAPHFAESASHFVDFSQADPNCAASWSTTMNPMLCRVAAYSGPGFPRPAMSRIAVSSTRGQSKIQNRKPKMDYFFSFSFGAFSFRSRSRRAAASPSSFFSVITSGPAAQLQLPLQLRSSSTTGATTENAVRSSCTFGVTPCWKLNVADVNGIADVQLRNVHRDPIRQITRQTFNR